MQCVETTFDGWIVVSDGHMLQLAPKQLLDLAHPVLDGLSPPMMR